MSSLWSPLDEKILNRYILLWLKRLAFILIYQSEGLLR